MAYSKISDDWKEISEFTKSNKIKLVSFDFWNTIAFSNPKFKTERTDLIFDLLHGKVARQKISDAFTSVGNAYNLNFENGGGTQSTEELYKDVLNTIGFADFCEIPELLNQIFELFLRYPPHLTNGFIKCIESLESNKVSCSITSNTTFIPGDIIEKFLSNSNLLRHFEFCLFSDREKVAKPNKEIFRKLITKAKSLSIETKDILHIGDNVQTDYFGAKACNLHAYHFVISSNKLNHKRFALYTIRDPDNIPFSEIEYSKFKYGDHSIAEKYGEDLFQYFKNEHLSSVLDKSKNILIYSSPYAHIPTSSYYLTQSFYRALTKYTISNRLSNIQIRFAKIQRCQTYTDDYGSMTAEERLDLIKNDTYKLIDKPQKEDFCIFIDDISITGTHQKVVEHLLFQNAIETNSIFLYLAKLSNPTIHPSFENHLNYAYINNITAFTELAISNEYKITTRAAKYLLSLWENDFKYFLDQIILNNRQPVLEELLLMSNANKYNNIDSYKKNLNKLNTTLQKLRLSSRNNDRK